MPQLDDYEKAAYTSKAVTNIVDSMNRREAKQRSKDKRGDSVESYKINNKAKPLLDRIRTTQKKIKAFQQVKAAITAKFEETEKILTTQSQTLLNLLPAEPMRDLQGMEFPDEDKSQGDQAIRY